LYGLIGYPLSHSFSPRYFQEKFEKEHIHASYELFPLENINQLAGLLASHPELKGLNVTIPYKSAIIPFLDYTDTYVQAIGAANCISIKNGKLTGHNTDVTGFTKSLRPLLKSYHTQALILGTGGAAKAIAYGLKQLGIGYQYVSRMKSDNHYTYDALSQEIMQENLLIINTTPLGMYPDIAAAPAIPYSCLSSKHLCYDLIYNPAVTSYLNQAAAHGATIKNGLEMLEIQAEESWNIWNQGL
jgi:shikimate dehydrogenase